MSDTPSKTSESVPQVAVVGCGYWGKNLVRNFNHLGALAALCDLNPQALQALGKDYKHARQVTDIQTLLNDPQIEAMVIATPSAGHYPLAKQALLAGKHVYIEKPIATRITEAEELVKLADDRQQILMVGHLLLYHPAVSRLKQLIDEGYLGEIRYIQSDRLNFNQNRQDESVLWDLAPHDLSMMIHLLGTPPEKVTAVQGHRTSTDHRIDVAHVELAFPNGIAGHIHNSWIHPSKQVKLVVRGTERIAVLDDTLNQGKLQIFRREEDQAPIQEFPEYLGIEPLKLECQHFLNAIRMRKSPRSSGENGIEVVRVLEEAHRKLSLAPISSVPM